MMKFLIVAFDGMRPDLVGPETTPNLFEFSRRYCRFTEHRCTFPSETYVNTTSLVTGSHPTGHGLLANVFNEATDGRGAWFQGWEVESIERLDRLAGGLFTALSAGEILGLAGERMAVISTNSAGSARLMHHRVDRFDHLNLCPHSIATSSPDPAVGEIVSRFPPPAEKSIPDFDGLTWAADVFLDFLVPRGLPALSFLWYGEPDNTFHMNGIGSPENLAALKHADAQLGRVIDWWLSRGRADGVQLLIVSDHGHVTIKEKVSVGDRLREGGFKTAPLLDGESQAALLDGLSSNLLVRGGDPILAAEIGAALMETDWLGSLFYNSAVLGREAVPGALPLDLVLSAHPRSPHLAWTFRSDDQPNRFGWTGRCYHDIDLPLGGGMHGGLHPNEMRCLLIAGGSIFKEKHRVETPTCLTDILPTVLHGLGLNRPGSMTGRILAESLAGADYLPRWSGASINPPGTATANTSTGLGWMEKPI